jgi:hypothetical protein
MKATPSHAQPCSVESCNRTVGRHGARGLCPGHYLRWQAHGDPGSEPIKEYDSTRPCRVESCGARAKAQGLCNTHYERLNRTGTLDRRTAADRFEAKVEKTATCWLWTGAKNNRGYGQFLGDTDRLVLAHRFSYELAIGPIPQGLTLDHLCRTPLCVNPAHLEAVTLRVNILRSESTSALNARKTHCPKGHPYAGDNLVVWGKTRRCRTCSRERDRERRKKT